MPFTAAAIGPQSWASTGTATRDLQENVYLKEAHGKNDGREVPRGRGRADLEEDNARARSLDRGCEGDHAAHRHALDISKQAEIISQQIRDIHRLEAECTGLRALSSQQEARLQEREEVLGRLQDELKGVRVQVANVEMQKTLGAEKAAIGHQTELGRLQLQAKIELERLESKLSQERDQVRAENERLRAELEAAVELHQREVTALRLELRETTEGRERDRRRHDERLQELLQDTEQKLQSQLSAAAVAHCSEADSLRQTARALQEDLRLERERGRLEATRLQEQLLTSRQQKDNLTEELSKVTTELETQNTLVQQLRTYIGEVVPDNNKAEEWRRERENFVGTVQHLESERTALRTTTELLNVRLSALTDILSIQELELGKKVRSNALDMESPAAATLLTCWRKKVFALMVQLKSQELNQENDARHIHSKISELEEELQASGQKQAVLLHSLQDRTAQLEMEKISNKTIQEELRRAQAGVLRAQLRAERTEEALQHLERVVGSFHQVFEAQESGLKSAAARLGSLGQRLCFAGKRVDTIQGMVARKMAIVGLQLEERSRGHEANRDSGQPSYMELQDEVALLHVERDRLSAELKLTAQMITKKVSEARDKADQELQDQQAKMNQLQENLEERVVSEQELTRRLILIQEQKEEAEQDLQQRLSEVEAELQETRGSLEEQKQHLAGLKDEYQQALQEKVSDAEARMLQQLSEMEKRVQEARREHTKAVVALRQAERQTVRDKERTQEMMRLQEEKHQHETQRLCQQLRELERDRNLMMATLRQEGLLKQHKQSRFPALRASETMGEEETEPPPTAPVPRATPLSKESLSSMLNSLQTLSAAILGEEEEAPSEDED
ncbi:hypothetical protein NDU88_012840 [Pleurodeles waltl]|uniref:Coiled-coil alpha-helical rod protein 1 n=1 Tax=Pleurodeles waltl TaxID=8319 RepID=A0AAV7R310_PLEWA|nr:hypothetical protein NDU88_012840 [Pleurodeles waltl]